jgi:chitodextrinase
MRFPSFALAAGLAALLGARPLAAQVPSNYQEIYSLLTTQISGFNSTLSTTWNGSTYPYLDAPQLQAANSDQYTGLLQANYYNYVVMPQLEELKALGANAITLHIDFPILYQPFYTYAGQTSLYPQFLAFYQQVVQAIRADGLKVVVEASSGMPLTGTNIAEFQAYAQSLSWPDYIAGRAAQALAVAQLIQPDYMSVMTEPDTEANVSGQTNLNNVAGVTQLVYQVLSTLVENDVRGVQIGAGAGTWTSNYLDYVQAYSAMPELNFLDMHIYPINNNYFTNAITAAQMAHAAGKQVGMTECWEWKIANNELGVVDYSTIMARDPFSFWAPVDTSFLQSIVNLANAEQFSFVAPYWTHYFFAYLDYTTDGSLPTATIYSDSYAAASNANLVGAFTSTGLAWETPQNIPPDTTPPAVPAAPTASGIGTNEVNLVWTADSDNVGVSAYNLYRNGALLATTTLLLYYDTGLESGTSYTYTLTAQDAAGNVSSVSPPLVVQTYHVNGPSTPTELAVSDVTSNSVSLNWSASSAAKHAVGYRVLRGATAQTLTDHALSSNPSYTDTVNKSTTYYFAVEPYNESGAALGRSNVVSVTTPVR